MAAPIAFSSEVDTGSREENASNAISPAGQSALLISYIISNFAPLGARCNVPFSEKAVKNRPTPGLTVQTGRRLFK
jgi:hypothetical protein